MDLADVKAPDFGRDLGAPWDVHRARCVCIRIFFWSVFSPNAGKYRPRKLKYGHFSCSDSRMLAPFLSYL